MQLVISRQGIVSCIYAESLDLASLGRLNIARGSHVEPDADGQWRVDLSPVGGPVLGPFSLRSTALAAEYAWLESYWLNTPDRGPSVQ
jgi:hypothetical protein